MARNRSTRFGKWFAKRSDGEGIKIKQNYPVEGRSSQAIPKKKKYWSIGFLSFPALPNQQIRLYLKKYIYIYLAVDIRVRGAKYVGGGRCRLLVEKAALRL